MTGAPKKGMEENVTGKVKFFDETKGWGFITRDDGKGEVFVHANELKRGGIESLSDGDALSFDVENAEKGKRAKKIARF